MSAILHPAPRVSIVTPSYGRQGWLLRLWPLIQAQTFPDWEWLVFDDTPTPCAPLHALAARAGSRVRYLHSRERFSIGEKRNVMVGMAAGELVAHFDDDDYYGPTYLARMITVLNGRDGGGTEEGADFVTLSGWFLYHQPSQAFGYWDCTRAEGRAERWSRRGIDPVENESGDPTLAAQVRANRLGFGFSYLYRRAVWLAQPFPTVNSGEDTPFAESAAARFRYRDLPDTDGLCLHILHGANSSRCQPQYRMPLFLLERLFGPDIASHLTPPKEDGTPP